MSNYDAIVIGAGHNGLTNAAYLAKAGLNVVVLEKNDYIGGAAVSRELHEGWTYSSCSYVCSMMRQAIHRDLDLARHGLILVPYLGITSKSCNMEIAECWFFFKPKIAIKAIGTGFNTIILLLLAKYL